MRVLYFGTYERSYPRNAQVISCLRRAGVEVVERHEPVWEEQEHKFGAGVGSAVRLAAAEVRLRRRVESDSDSQFDAVLVGYPGHLDLGAARRIAGSRPVVFNPLVSLSDTLVGDRGRFRPGSVPARMLQAIDRRAFRAANLVVADTAAQAEFFLTLGARRVDVCFVGAEERVFRPGWQPAGRLHRSLRRQADPAARTRHRAGRSAARPGDPVPHRRFGPTRPAPRGPPAERGARALGRIRAPAGGAVRARRARWASSAPRQRHGG